MSDHERPAPVDIIGTAKIRYVGKGQPRAYPIDPDDPIDRAYLAEERVEELETAIRQWKRQAEAHSSWGWQYRDILYRVIGEWQGESSEGQTELDRLLASRDALAARVASLEAERETVAPLVKAAVDYDAHHDAVGWELAEGRLVAAARDYAARRVGQEERS